MIYGYARVSTDAHDETGQVRQTQGGRMRKDIPREDHRYHGRPAAACQVDQGPRPRRCCSHPAVDRLSRDTTDLLVVRSFGRQVLEISPPTGSANRVRTNALTAGAVSRPDNGAMGPNSASP